ncbi:MAG: PQQ-binding-like beta-propeller repeat protein [Candidatus Saccharibacteria bacterium]
MANNRKQSTIAISVLVVVALVLATGIFFFGQPNQTKAAVGGAPSEITQFINDWPLMNKDYANTRATNTSSIFSGNVKDLGVAWTYNITGFGRFGAASSNPIIIGNDVLFQDMKGNVVNLDLRTGNINWIKNYNSSAIEGPNGPAVGYGKVFVAKDVHNVTALDLNTGQELWTTNLFVVNTTGIDIQPIVYDGLVYVASVPGTGDVFYAPGGVGVLYALNQQTGSVVWNFTTVKDPNMWGHPEVNSGGGSWYPPAIDTSTGLMYWGVANPAPFPGTPAWPNGSSFANVSTPYVDSIVALDHATGALKYANQLLSHDIWDHDLQLSPILATATWNGVQQDIALVGGKMGNVYAVNRDTGNLLWTTPVGKHQNDLNDPINGTEVVFPGIFGGIETPMAYANGVVYAAVVNMPTTFNSTAINRSTVLNFSLGSGQIVAIDVNTGHIMWEHDLDSINFGAATVVNDVLFTASFNGTVYGYGAMNGTELFRWKAPAGTNAWPAVAGDTIIWPFGVGKNASLVALRLGAGNLTGGNQTIGTPGNTTSGNQTSNGTSGTSTTIDLTAQNLGFDKSTITVPAGAQITVNFHNKDNGIQHNFAVYDSQSMTRTFFKGQIITGVSDITYTFTSPTTPGTYYFQCDVHGSAMSGSFVVQ